jgi:hypothetical protein
MLIAGCEVVREVSSRVDLAVLGAVAAAFFRPRRAWRGSGGGGPRRRLCPQSTLLRAARPGCSCGAARRGSRPCGRARGPRLWRGQSAGPRGGRARGTQRRCGGGAPSKEERKLDAILTIPLCWSPIPTQEHGVLAMITCLTHFLLQRKEKREPRDLPSRGGGGARKTDFAARALAVNHDSP